MVPAQQADSESKLWRKSLSETTFFSFTQQAHTHYYYIYIDSLSKLSLKEEKETLSSIG